MESVLFVVKGEKNVEIWSNYAVRMSYKSVFFFNNSSYKDDILLQWSHVILIYMSSFFIFYYPDILYIFQKW